MGAIRKSDGRCLPGASAKCREREGDGKKWRQKGKVEKREEKLGDIIRSRTERRSCRLRDRTQNGAGAPPGPGTTHRKQSKYACEHVRVVVVAFVAAVRVKTTRRMRMMSQSSTVSSFLMTFEKLRPVGNRIKITPEAMSAHPSNMVVSQRRKGIRDRRQDS